MILRSLNILVILAWAIFLGLLLTYGGNDLVRLIHPRLWWVLGVAVAVLVLFLFSLITPSSKPDPNKSFLLELPSILILLVPIVYFSIAKEARLDGTSIQNRLTQTDNGMYLNNLPSTGLFNESDSTDMLFSKILRQPGKYENKEVEVVCQSFVNDKLPENIAMCYRYIITCCAADALPAFFFLRYQGELEIENDRWIRVNGPLSIIKKSKMEIPTIEVDVLEYVTEPDFPWAM